MTQVEFADYVGAGRTTIEKLCAAGLIKRKKKGAAYVYDIDSVKSYYEYQLSKFRGGTEEKRDADTRMATAKAEAAEFDLALKRSQYVTVEEADREGRRLLSLLRGRILNFPARAGPRLLNLKNTKQATKRVRELMRELMALLANPEDDADDKVATG